MSASIPSTHFSPTWSQCQRRPVSSPSCSPSYAPAAVSAHSPSSLKINSHPPSHRHLPPYPPHPHPLPPNPHPHANPLLPIPHTPHRPPFRAPHAPRRRLPHTPSPALAPRKVLGRLHPDLRAPVRVRAPRVRARGRGQRLARVRGRGARAGRRGRGGAKAGRRARARGVVACCWGRVRAAGAGELEELVGEEACV